MLNIPKYKQLVPTPLVSLNLNSSLTLQKKKKERNHLIKNDGKALIALKKRGCDSNVVARSTWGIASDGGSMALLRTPGPASPSIVGGDDRALLTVPSEGLDRRPLCQQSWQRSRGVQGLPSSSEGPSFGSEAMDLKGHGRGVRIRIRSDGTPLGGVRSAGASGGDTKTFFPTKSGPLLPGRPPGAAKQERVRSDGAPGPTIEGRLRGVGEKKRSEGPYTLNRAPLATGGATKGPNSYLIPDFVEIQRKSFFQLLKTGLIDEFSKRNPITNKNLEIFFYPEYYQLTPPEYNPRRAILISKSYSSKLYIPAQLTDKKLKKSQLKWVLIGNLPLMTKRGHFVLNGAPRVIVNQILRSPGIYFQGSIKEVFSDQWSEKAEITYKRFYTDLICLRGTWLRIEIDKNKDIWAQMKKVPKIPLLWFLLAMGLTERIIFKSILNPTRLLANFNLEIKRKIDYNYVTNASDAWKEISNLISSSNKETGFSDSDYGSESALLDLLLDEVEAPLRRGKGTKKKTPPVIAPPVIAPPVIAPPVIAPPVIAPPVIAPPVIAPPVIAPPVIAPPVIATHARSASDDTPGREARKEGPNEMNPRDNEVIKGASLLAYRSGEARLRHTPNFNEVKQASTSLVSFVNIVEHSKEGPRSPAPAIEGRNWIFKRFMNPRAYDLGSQGRLNFNRKLGLSISSNQRTLTAQDLLFATDHLFKVEKGLKNIDDIDHLKNRRVRTSGELLQIQIGIGLVRLEKIIRDKLSKINAQARASEFLTSKPNNPKMDKNSSSYGVKPILRSRLSTRVLSGLSRFSAPVAGQNKKKDEGAKKKNRRHASRLLPPLGVLSPRHRSAHRKALRSPSEALLIAIEADNTQKGERRGRRETSHLTPKKTSGKIYNTEEFKINNLINTKAFNGALREFFGSSQLSQFMDQLNPLAEITHKRRLSSMGPGGVTRDSATLAIRGIHPTHYGRICPIETPEGKNTGLVNSLTTYARASSQGFLESPFYKVYKGQIQKDAGMFFLSAEQEENIKVAAADVATSYSSGGGRISFLPKNKIPAKIAYGDTITKISRNVVEYIGVSPIQMISIATSLIPFLEHDDANRALMGSNMQRQAVPLVRAERPLVGTGLESRTVSDSGHAVIAKESGYVAYVSAKKIIIYTIPNEK